MSRTVIYKRLILRGYFYHRLAENRQRVTESAMEISGDHLPAGMDILTWK
jgi:hypothetical protein